TWPPATVAFVGPIEPPCPVTPFVPVSDCAVLYVHKTLPDVESNALISPSMLPSHSKPGVVTDAAMKPDQQSFSACSGAATHGIPSACHAISPLAGSSV